MSERLGRLLERDLDEDQLAVYRGITGGPRASGKQLFPLTDSDGALNGPFGAMLHAPGLGAALQELGAAVRYRSSLTDREREIAILQVAAATACEFEQWAHERVGRAVGVTADEVGALARGVDFSTTPHEDAVRSLTATTLAGDDLTDEEFTALAGVLTSQEIVEVVILVGYYRLLAQVMQVFDIGIPHEGEPWTK